MPFEQDAKIFSAMQEGNPHKIYKKTILGKVYITVLNPFSGEPEGVILSGNPNDPKDFDSCTIEIWDVMQDQFFLRINKNQFNIGNLVEVTNIIPEQKFSNNQITDDEIIDILNKPFLALKAQLNKFTTTSPVYRTLALAEELEKSEKILNAIRARASELEVESYKPSPED